MNQNWRQALTDRGARFEGERVTDFGPAQREAPPTLARVVLAPLLSEGLILVSGEDALAFLQGQVSNDVEQVSATRAQFAAYCTPKGRVLATLVICQADNGYALALPGELSESIRRRLQMYVLRSRVRLDNASDQIAVLGLAGADARAMVSRELEIALSSAYDAGSSGGLTAVALPGDRIQITVDVARGIETWDKFAARCPLVGEQAWDAHAIAAGVPTITSTTQDQFTPHMLNLDLLGGVSFSKGCYTGQEIVARTQYLGQVKRRLARFVTAGRAEPGGAVYAEGQPAGTVVNAVRSPDGCDLLAVVQTQAALSAAAGIALRLGDPQGPALRPLALPYPLPGMPEQQAIDDA
ncbi:MAG TPA: folate-binding protein [Burkholderiales bacterium]|nr:folate-binding protein [Burkholderiales bacterium]